MEKKTALITAGIALGSLAVGGVGGYFIGAKRTEKAYKEVVDEALEDLRAKTKDASDRANKTGAYATPASAHEALVHNPDAEIRVSEEDKKGLRDLAEDHNYAYDQSTLPTSERDQNLGRQSIQEAIEEPDAPVTVISVDGEAVPEDAPTPELDQAEEINAASGEEPAEQIVRETVRKPDAPYEISIDESMEQHPEYDSIVLFYYEGDDTLAGENDVPIDDIEAVVGRASLELFGDRSGDKDIVYVRNERIGADYEIHRVKNSYEEVHLGAEPSENIAPINRKMRDNE